MLRIAICDDTTPHAEQLAAHIQRELRTQRFELEGFPSPDELLRYIRTGGYEPDIALVGVEAGKGGGIALAEQLNELLPACRIIFVSDSLRAACDVYRAEHVWFIFRGQLEQRIAPALHKAISSLDAGRGTGRVIRQKGKAVFIPRQEVLYLERRSRHTLIRTETGEFISSERPEELLAGDHDGSYVRCHRSFWVSKSKISAMEGSEFLLRDGSRVPISRSFRCAARAAFLGSGEP